MANQKETGIILAERITVSNEFSMVKADTRLYTHADWFGKVIVQRGKWVQFAVFKQIGLPL